MVVFVVVPRSVSAPDVIYAAQSGREAGYSPRLTRHSLPGHVQLEFWVALEREEDPEPEAFEIEVDDTLRQTMAPFLDGAMRRIRFSGSGARVEIR